MEAYVMGFGMPKGGLEPPRAKRSHGPQPCVSTKFHHFGKMAGVYETIPNKNKIYIAINFYSVPEVSFLFQRLFSLRQVALHLAWLLVLQPLS